MGCDIGLLFQFHYVYWSVFSLSVLQVQAVVKKYDILFIADEVCAYLIEPCLLSTHGIMTPNRSRRKETIIRFYFVWPLR